MNRTRTLLLMAGLTALFLWAGHAFGGQGGLVRTLGLASIMNFGTYLFSDRIVLRMHGAQEVPEHAAPGLHQMVLRLAMRANKPVPKLYIIDEESHGFFFILVNLASVIVQSGSVDCYLRDIPKVHGVPELFSSCCSLLHQEVEH